MARSTTFRDQHPDGQKQEIDLGKFHSIAVHFRFPDNAKLVTLEGFEGRELVPPDVAKDFLHWLAEI